MFITSRLQDGEGEGVQQSIISMGIGGRLVVALVLLALIALLVAWAV